MRLRERQAAATRAHILDAALALFLERGFEATRMEEVAERAEVGTSTLYRYFPTKDRLITDPLALDGQMARELRARPADEPLDLALGHALTALLTTPRTDPRRLRQVLAVLETAPGLRTRLLEEFVRERTLLEQAIADRLGRPADDVFCLLTARVVTTVVELIGPAALGQAADDESAERAAVAMARDLLGRLQAEPPVVPRLPTEEDPP